MSKERTGPIIKTWHRHTNNGGQSIQVFDYRYTNDYPQNSYTLQISDDGYCGLSSMKFRIESLKIEDLKNIVNTLNEIIQGAEIQKKDEKWETTTVLPVVK